MLSREDLEPWLDGFVPYALARADVAGAVVVVVKDGKALLQKGYGYSDVAVRRPVDPETTLFRIGSVSKLFTWTAVMQLAEQRRIRLGEDINTYLDFKIPPFEGRPITMRDLMTHTGGFQDSLKDLITAKSTAPTLGDFLKQQVPERIFPPGTVPAYSNYGAGLAGYIVQRVSGRSFADYVEQHVFTPLNMHHSTFRQPLPTALAPFMARGYLAASDGAKPFEMFGPAPAGSASATGADMAKFMIAHLQDGEYGGHRILEPDTAIRMHTQTLATVSPAINSIVLGFFQNVRNGHRIIGHDGDTRFFHSALSLFLDDNVGLFISLNSAGRNADTYGIRQALFDGFVDRYFPGPSPSGAMPLQIAKAHAAMMVGRYDGSRREQTTFLSFATLFSQAKISSDELGHLVTPFTGLNDQQETFEEIAPFLWREVGDKDLLAAKVVNGKVTLWGDGGDATGVYTPTPLWRSSTWLLPLCIFSVAALLISTVAWPLVAIVRRKYGVTLPSSELSVGAGRWVHIAVAAECIVIIGWLALIGGMGATFYVTFAPYFISSSMGKFILTLHLLSIVVLPLASLVAIWNVRTTFANHADRRHAFSRVWSVVLTICSLTVLWVAIVFHFIGVSSAF